MALCPGLQSIRGQHKHSEIKILSFASEISFLLLACPLLAHQCHFTVQSASTVKKKMLMVLKLVSDLKITLFYILVFFTAFFLKEFGLKLTIGSSKSK